MAEKSMRASELSRLSGVTEASISEYLKGKKEPRGKQSIAIANALNVSLDELWGTEYAESERVRREATEGREKAVRVVSGIIGVSVTELGRMDFAAIETALKSNLSNIGPVSGIDSDAGKYVSQLPPEAIASLNNHIRLLARAYIKQEE